MVAEKPTNVPKPASWWSARRVCVVLAVLFAVIFAVSWWLTPVGPNVTLHLDDSPGMVLFSPDGSMLVTSGKGLGDGAEGPLRVWDVGAGYERYSIPCTGSGATCFTPDSRLLAAYDHEGILTLWDTGTGKIVSDRPKAGLSMRFSPDGRFLVFRERKKGLANENRFTFWNIETRREQGSVESFLTPKFSPDGRRFATFVSSDRQTISEVMLWKLDHVPVLMKRHRITAHEIAISPDLTTFATGDNLPNNDGEITLWDIATGQKHWSRTFNQHGTRLESLSFVGKGNILAACGKQENPAGLSIETLWDVTSAPKQIGSFLQPVTVSPDGEWLAIRLDSGVRLINVKAQDQGTDLLVSGDFTEHSPEFSPDSKMVVVDVRSEKEPFLGKWLPPRFNPFDDEPAVRVWSVGAKPQAFTFGSGVWFSPTGETLATFRGTQTIDLWDVPLRMSVWRTLGWAFLGWTVVILVWWLGFQTRRWVHST